MSTVLLRCLDSSQRPLSAPIYSVHPLRRKPSISSHIAQDNSFLFQVFPETLSSELQHISSSVKPKSIKIGTFEFQE